MVAAGEHEAAGVLGDSEDKTAEAPNIALEYGKWLMSSCTAPVGVEALCRLGNISTAMQLLFVLIFMCVETSGAAGGTSGVAGTPITLLSDHLCLSAVVHSTERHLGRVGSFDFVTRAWT